MRRKLAFYQTDGIEESYIYDPDHHTLAVRLRPAEQRIQLALRPGLVLVWEFVSWGDRAKNYGYPDGTALLFFRWGLENRVRKLANLGELMGYLSQQRLASIRIPLLRGSM